MWSFLIYIKGRNQLVFPVDVVPRRNDVIITFMDAHVYTKINCNVNKPSLRINEDNRMPSVHLPYAFAHTKLYSNTVR